MSLSPLSDNLTVKLGGRAKQAPQKGSSKEEFGKWMDQPAGPSAS
jgi:hypothetical protein